jgi:hypothetical protein
MGFAIWLLCACLFFGGCATNDPKSGITPDQARVIADEKMIAAGFEPGHWLLVKLHDDPDNRCLSYQHPDPDYMADVAKIKRILAGHRYYLVMYEPGPDVLFGSAVCLFIEETTGNILASGRF